MMQLICPRHRIPGMKYKCFADMNCSLAQALDIVGERWTLLILRDAFFGVRRFVHFERNLGIAKNILTARLNRLVDEGLLDKRPSDGTAHPEYVLTEAGWDLQPVLLALAQWGEKHRPDPRGARMLFVDRRDGEPIAPLLPQDRKGRPLAPQDVRGVPGPALADGG